MTQVSPRGVFRILLVGVPATLAAAATFFYRIIAPSCESVVVAEFPAPHRLLKASVSVRKCRVTQVFTTQVSVLPANQTRLPDTPNVVAVQGDTLFGRSLGAPEVAIIWATDSSLVVRYAITRTAVRSTRLLAGVAVQFENRR